jgi:hypothetical protein
VALDPRAPLDSRGAEEIDLAALRAERLRRWHLAGNPLADVDEAIEFLRTTGFALAHRARTFLLPSFVEALAGGKAGVPAYGEAAGHPLYARYVAIRHHPRLKRLAIEAPILRRRHALVLRDHMVDFARLLADPGPVDRRSAGSRAATERLLALVGDRGPVSKRELRLAVSAGPRWLAGGGLDRALLDLESRLHIITVGYSEKEGAAYDLFSRAHRALAVRAARRSRTQSLIRLVACYVRSAVVVEPARVAEVFRGLAAAAEVRAVVAILATAGQLARGRAAGQEWLRARE